MNKADRAAQSRELGRIKELVPAFEKEYLELCKKYSMCMMPFLNPKGDNVNFELKMIFVPWAEPTPEEQEKIDEMVASEEARKILSPQ